MIEQKIKQSIVLDRTIPEYVVEEYPRFVEFVRAYYRFLEADGGAVDQLNKILANKDISTVSSDSHKYYILNTFMNSIPKTLEVEYETLLLNIRQFYSDRGTEGSIKTFFYLMSESKKPYKISVRWGGDEDSLVGLTVFGSSSGAKATIIRANRVSPSSSYVLLTLEYSTEPEYSKRFFTSVDNLKLPDGTEIKIEVEDYKVELFYPSQYILRSSDGIYEREFRCRFKLPEGEYKNFTNKQFVTSSGSEGRIEKQTYALKTFGGYDYYDMTLSFQIRRNWATDEQMIIDGEVISLVPVLTQVNINTPGQGYVIGQKFRVLNTGGEQVASIVIQDVCVCRVTSLDIQNGGTGYSVGDKFRFRYSDGLFGSGYVSSVSSGTISAVFLESTRKGSTEIPTIEFLSGNQSAVIYPMGFRLSGVEKILIEDVGFDVEAGSYVDIPTQTYPYTTANLTVQTGYLYRTNPTFKDDRGELSSYYRLQDNNYWQDYSYDIRFNRPTKVDDLDSLFQQTVHPAGFKYFYTYRRSEQSVDADNSIKSSSNEKIIKIHERMGNVVIRDYAYDPIGSVPRIKDTNPFYTYIHGLNIRESLKVKIFDDYMYFPSDNTKVEDLYETDSPFKFTADGGVIENRLKTWTNTVNVVDFVVREYSDYGNNGLTHLGNGPVLTLNGENIIFVESDD